MTIKRQDVSLTTLASIAATYKPAEVEINFLKVDVEGLEAAVLKGNDWLRFRPWIVLVEATLPMSQVESYEDWEPILLDADYIFVYADGLNRFYVARERSELMSAFRFPPNVFDAFVQVNQQKTAIAQSRAAEKRAARAEVAERDLIIQLQQTNAQLQQFQDSSARLETELRVMLTSNSWKITAPLRWLTTQLRRLRQDGLKTRIVALAIKIYRTFKAIPKSTPVAGKRELTPRGLIIYESLKQESQAKNRGEH